MAESAGAPHSLRTRTEIEMVIMMMTTMAFADDDVAVDDGNDVVNYLSYF